MTEIFNNIVTFFSDNPYLSSSLFIATAQLGVMASPGPSMATTIQYGLTAPRRVPIFCALGISVAIIFHVMLAMFGVGAVLKSNQYLLGVLQTLGSIYLIYLGTSWLFSKRDNALSFCSEQELHEEVVAATRQGFLVTIANPQAVLFFVVTLAGVWDATTPIVTKAGHFAQIFALTFAWFSFIGLCLSTKSVQAWFSGKAYLIDRVSGIFLIVLGFILFYKGTTKIIEDWDGLVKSLSCLFG